MKAEMSCADTSRVTGAGLYAGMAPGLSTTAGVTLRLDWQLNQIIVRRDSSRRYQSRSHTSIQTSASYPRGISAGHFCFHASNLIEPIQWDEGSKLWLIGKNHICRCGSTQILPHIGENITSSSYRLQRKHFLYFDEQLITVFRC